MKYNINKFQDGGGFPTSTFVLNNYPGPQINESMGISGQPRKSDDTEEGGSFILDKKGMEKLYSGIGLVSDVNKLVSEIIQLEKMSDLPYLNQNNRVAALRIADKMNTIVQNKENWTRVIQAAEKEGGLNEVAVNNGRIFIKDKDNKLQSMSLTEYATKRNKVRPLSFAEVMQERQYKLADQNNFFSMPTIGMNKITDHIKGLISVLGKETSETSKFYSKDEVKNYLASTDTKKPTAEEQASLSVLHDIVNTPGEYAQIEQSVVSQRNQIGKALGYIWNTLGSPAQQKLAATAAISGIDDPKRFILEMLQSQSDYSTKTVITPKELPGSTKSADKDTKNVALSPAELWHNDRLYRPGMSYEINNTKAGVSMRATATAIGALQSLNKPGETLGGGMITNVINSSNYRSIVDPNKAYIGDTKIDPMMMKEIAYTGDDVAKVYLPVKENGTPDLGQMERFDKAYQVFNINKGTWSIEESENYFKKAGFSNVQIKTITEQDGSITKVIAENGSVRPFLALPVITNSASDISDIPWMAEMIGNQKESAEALMDEVFTTYGGTSAKPKVIDNKPNKFWSWNTPYKGIMFVAYRPDASAMISSMSGHMLGKAPNETDLSRNVNFSSATINPAGIQSSAMPLK